MKPLKFTIIREDNTVDEEEFEGSCEVIYRKERINLKNLNEQRLSESISESGKILAHDPPGVYFAFKYIYNNEAEYKEEINAVGLLFRNDERPKEKRNPFPALFSDFSSCDVKIYKGDTVKCNDWEMKINSKADMSIVVEQLKLEYNLQNEV